VVKEKNMKKEHSCEHCETDKKKWVVGKRLKIVGLIFLGVFLISFLPVPVLVRLNESLLDYFKLIWWAVLLGFLIGGMVDYFVPDEFIFKYLGQKRKRSLFSAVGAGFLMSACSHGILAISMQLYKKGASIPAVMTFLLASPWANLPVTILLFSFFGWKALVFVGLAMMIALTTGGVFMVLEKVGWIEESKKVKSTGKIEWVHLKNFNLKASIEGTTKGAMDLANMVLWWLLIGLLLAGVIGAYVPGHILVQYFGANFVGLLLTLGLATVIEVCSEGSAPIAFEIFKHVGKLGNPFVFLMAGVVTDYTEIGLIWSNIGKKTAIWLPIITVPQVLLVGYLLNQLL